MHEPDPLRIVFIEPAASHTEHLRQLLQFEGMTVAAFGPGDTHRLPDLHADLVVLNHARLRGNTVTIAESAGRLQTPRPLTLALVSPGDELKGIELVERGVDAYIVCPCGAREFVARVRALLRRARRPSEGGMSGTAGGAMPSTVSAGALHIDPLRRRVRLRGCDLRLTEQEFQLLYLLAGNPGRVFDRPALLDAVWGSHTYVTTRSVDALVKRLRHQLRPAARGESFVETVRGVGYRMPDTGRSHAISAA